MKGKHLLNENEKKERSQEWFLLFFFVVCSSLNDVDIYVNMLKKGFVEGFYLQFRLI